MNLRFFKLEENKFEMTTATDYCVESHMHSFFEIAYFTDNSGTHYFNGTAQTFKPGDYVIIDKGTYHSYESLDKKEFNVYNLLFLPEFLDNTLYNCPNFSSIVKNYLIPLTNVNWLVPSIDRIFHDDNGEILSLFNAIEREGEQMKAGYLQVIRNYLTNIIIKTLRKITNNNIGSNYSKKVLNEINKRCTENLTLADIAEKYHYSVSYLSMRFKTDTGMTFSQALQKARIEVACKLLASSEKKISEIANLSGYKDNKTFLAVFKSVMGMTPTQYKKLLKDRHMVFYDNKQQAE